jgi:hypothetical protein
MVCGCMVFDHVSQSVCVIAYGTMDPMRTRRLGVVKTKMAIRKIAEATLHCNLRLSRALVAFCLICLLRGLSFLCVCWSLSLSLSLSFSFSFSRSIYVQQRQGIGIGAQRLMVGVVLR